RQKATALPSRQGLSAIGIAARSWVDCQSFPHVPLASNQKGPPRPDSARGGAASRHGQTYQLGSMKISSQLANNFDYCSAEIGVFFDEEIFSRRPPRLSGVISVPS